VAALIIVMSVMNGFRYELINRILGFNGHVTVAGSGNFNIGNYDQLALKLAEIDGVLTATPTIEGQVLATSTNAQAGALVRGVSREDLERQTLIADNIEMGSLAEFGTVPGVVVGAKLLQRLGLNYGDNITLISPKGVPTAFGTVPRSVAYPVIGVFDVGMYEFDSSVVFMPLDQAQVYFRLEDAVTQIELTVTNPEEPQAVREAARRVADPFYVLDWQQANRHLYGALQVERNVMFLILTLIIVVAAFNIISSLIMLVKDKNADIAIMRTMGATRGSLMRIFLLTGASIGIVGTLVGLGLGIVFCLNIESIRQFIQYLTSTELFPSEVYFLSQLPARVEWVEVASIVVMALVLTFLATLYPAWRAARIDPAEALRYE
jgi:lipoprotein-releasing system permease protein